MVAQSSGPTLAEPALNAARNSERLTATLPQPNRTLIPAPDQVPEKAGRPAEVRARPSRKTLICKLIKEIQIGLDKRISSTRLKVGETSSVGS
jgi:hypothetical protein